MNSAFITCIRALPDRRSANALFQRPLAVFPGGLTGRRRRSASLERDHSLSRDGQSFLTRIGVFSFRASARSRYFCKCSANPLERGLWGAFICDQTCQIEEAARRQRDIVRTNRPCWSVNGGQHDEHGTGQAVTMTDTAADDLHNRLLKQCLIDGRMRVRRCCVIHNRPARCMLQTANIYISFVFLVCRPSGSIDADFPVSSTGTSNRSPLLGRLMRRSSDCRRVQSKVYRGMIL